MTGNDRVQTLILACGNPSRGDDALGPLLIERLAARLGDRSRAITILTDFQLQIEHVLDLQGHDRVIIVDAALAGPGPFVFVPVRPAATLSWSSHLLSPRELLTVFQQVTGARPPPTRLLGIRGYQFALGAALSPQAGLNLDAALDFLSGRLARPRT